MDNKAYHHGNLREELVTEAMKVLREQNVKAVTLRKLSNSLGVSRAALYRHFRNKEALLTAVAALGFRMMRESFERNPQPEKPEYALAAIMENYITFATGNPKLYKLMFSRGIFSLPVSNELREAASDACSGVTEILKRMKSENDPAVSINTAWALVHGLSLLINENLLAVNEDGNTGHALIAQGKGNPSSKQLADQISSAVSAMVTGISETVPGS